MPRSDLLRVLAPPMRRQRLPLLRSAVLSVLQIAVELAQPWPLAIAVDVAITGDTAIPAWLPLDRVALLVTCGAATLILSAGAGLLGMAATRSAEGAAEHVGAELRGTVFDRAVTLSLRWHDRLPGGELVARLTTDVGRLLDAVVALAAGLAPDVLMVAGVLALLVAVDPALAGIGVAILPVLAVLSVQQRRRVRGSQLAARTESGRLAGATSDLIRNVRAVQAFGRADRAGIIFRQHNDALLGVSLRAVATESRWSPVSDVVLAVGAAAVLVTGGLQVMAGGHTIGNLLVVMAYLRQLYAPVRSLTRLSTVLAKADASAGRVAAILDCGEAIQDLPDAVAAPAMITDVRLTGVDFGYDRHHRVLHEFDLHLTAGETVCLWGPSGAGKSTVLQLLLRLYDVDAGQVLVNGVDIRRIRQRSLREQIAFVPQDPWLLDGTIAQNIAFGFTAATRAAVLEAGRRAGVDEFAHQLPLGYDSQIGEAGARLSGGQRRRVAIARAAVSTASLVLLDEPTASLDAAAADHVIRAIRNSTANRTTLIVTHDPALARIADRVVHLGPSSGPLATPASPPERNRPT